MLVSFEVVRSISRLCEPTTAETPSFMVSLNGGGRWRRSDHGMAWDVGQEAWAKWLEEHVLFSKRADVDYFIQ